MAFYSLLEREEIMVKVTDIKLNSSDMTAEVSLFADTKSEVIPNMVIKGMPEGYTIAQGSDVMTAKAEMAFMQSTGQWSWV